MSIPLPAFVYITFNMTKTYWECFLVFVFGRHGGYRKGIRRHGFSLAEPLSTLVELIIMYCESVDFCLFFPGGRGVIEECRTGGF